MILIPKLLAADFVFQSVEGLVLTGTVRHHANFGEQAQYSPSVLIVKVSDCIFFP